MASPQAPLGALLLSVVRPAAEALLRRALGWAQDLERLGVDVPLPLAHDLGLLLAAPMNQLDLGARRGAAQALGNRPGAPKMHEAYAEAVASLSTDDTFERVRALRPSDDLVVVLLTRLLARPEAARRTEGGVEGVDLTNLSDLDRRLGALFDEAPRDADVEGIARFLRELLRLRVVLDTIDLDTIRLLAVIGHGSETTPMYGGMNGLAQVELLATLESVQANDVVNFSLELLPAVLETKRRTAPGTFATGGYQGLSRRGSLDSLVLTARAWDDAELTRRRIDDEVLVHARERGEDEAARMHLVLVDASASMRGDRTTFARGVAIALAKRLELEGEEARIRFFDRRLYEPFGGAMASSDRPGARRGALAAALPHILAFRGEHGRSPERVLRQLVGELDVLRARDRRSPVVHLITHAAFYAPRALVAEVHGRAALFAVFIVPQRGEPDGRGDELDVDFLDLLDGHWTVDQATLARADARARRGKEIVRSIPKSAPDLAAPEAIPNSGPVSSRRGAPSRRGPPP
ncbi:MAG: hypothetical protein NVSMB47_19200 [Polyangiales bacterium]